MRVHTLEQQKKIDHDNARTIRKVVRIGGEPAVAYTYKDGVYFTFDFIKREWNCDKEMVKKIEEFLN
jgi:hypothetical protein